MTNLTQQQLEELEDAARKDPLVYGILHIDLLQNREWEVDTRAWMPEIYQVVNPYYIEKAPQGQAKKLTIQKSTQCGMSTMAAVRMFHMADNWPVRVMYMLPRQQDYIDFVTTRVNPMISASPRLQKLLGDVDSTRAKELGQSYLFFMESTVEPRMMPADAIFVDEIDLSDPTNVSTLENRMDASPWELGYYFSTPTLPNYGINGLYEQSDMRQWFVKCPACNDWQTMDWDIHLRVEGSRLDPRDVYFGCQKCNHRLTLDIIQEGQWVAQYPERSHRHIGFQISQMMTHSPWRLYMYFIEPKTRIHEFYRKRLGKPYEVGIGSIDRDQVLSSCFDEPYDFEEAPDGKSTYFLGADQGNELQVLIGKIDRETKERKIVRVETIPYDEGGFSRLGQLIHLYKIKKGVLDGDPNRHSARDLQDEFLGRLLIADYAESKTDWKTSSDPKKGNVQTNVTIGRTEGFDALIEEIKKRQWKLPGILPTLPPDTELVIGHITALRRDLEIRKTAAGEKEVGVWRELRPSHLAHAWLYLRVAMEVDKGKDFRTQEVGTTAATKEELLTPEGFSKSVVREITGLLAEVPLNQLEGYIKTKDLTPFPLSFKMGKVQAGNYTEDEIVYAITRLIADKRLANP